MLVEAKQAFYNEETGAVQPWRDIEVTDDLGNELVSEGLVAAIAAGGGGGGDYLHTTFTLVNNSSEEYETDAFLSVIEGYAFDNNGFLDFLLNYGKIRAGETAVIVAFYVGDSTRAEIIGTPSDIVNITMEDTYAVITDITQNSAMTITITD